MIMNNFDIIGVHSQLDFYLSLNVSVIVRVRGKLVRLGLEVTC